MRIKVKWREKEYTMGENMSEIYYNLVELVDLSNISDSKNEFKKED